MFKSIKTILWATFVASLSLGFASCSSDDDGEKPVVVETHRIPTKITEKRLASASTGELERESVYTISYDANNRVKSVERVSKYGTDIQNVVYNTDGTISKIGGYTYEYDAKEGKIMEYYKEGSESDVIFVDKEGYPRSYTKKMEDGEETVTLIYDINRNLIKGELKSKSDSERENSVTDINSVFAYNSYYNPFVSINMPAWVPQSGLDLSDLFDAFSVGKLMIGESILKEVEVTTTGGKETETYKYSYTAKYTITKSEDNYPTELTVIGVSEENNDDAYEQKTTFTIEYKDAN